MALAAGAYLPNCDTGFVATGNGMLSRSKQCRLYAKTGNNPLTIIFIKAIDVAIGGHLPDRIAIKESFMSDRVFLAGATGAIGRLLTPRLVAAGYEVFGTTRRSDRAKLISEIGATPVIVDVFDAEALGRVLLDSSPQIVIHQLTDLPFGLDPAKMAEGRIRNARLREVGTKNLVEAAVAAGTDRIISQSIAWSYRTGNTPHREEDPLDDTATAIKTLEGLTLETPNITGTVLRYGLLYGPGTGVSLPNGKINVHVHDAAEAAFLSAQRKVHGIFNIVEDSSVVSNKKAKLILHWQPASDSREDR